MSIEFEGKNVEIQPGDTLASALYRDGVRVFSRSFKYHRPRGLYCLSGDCPNCLVTVDGGVRRGSDVVKACALGARAVMFGRPYLYGLGAAGALGVEWVIDYFATGIKDLQRLWTDPNFAG